MTVPSASTAAAFRRSGCLGAHGRFHPGLAPPAPYAASAYLAALLIWGGLAAGFRGLAVLAIGAIYVLPAYRIFIHAEVQMMVEHFGEDYARYREHVPMLAPSRLPLIASAPGRTRRGSSQQSDV